MTESYYDLCIIGAGSGGLTLAAGAAQMGAKTALIEKHKMGGDCLNYGCVPSKALLAAAKHAGLARRSRPFGIEIPEVKIDFARVKDHVSEVIARIAPHDSVERFTELGVDVIKGAARFLDTRHVEVKDQYGKKRVIKARRFVIATGAVPRIPPLPGLEDVSYFTNETIFSQQEKPNHLLIIGGGPIGMEMAQAHAQLGCRVSLLEQGQILPHDDPELAALVEGWLMGVGVEFYQQVKIERLRGKETEITLHFKDIKKEAGQITGSHLLLATGRQANIEGLNLDKAGVKFTAAGIAVDKKLRTSNKKIYAIGDVIGGTQFTHAAAYQAGLVLRHALFRLPINYRKAVIPHVTYTDPELAHIGLREEEARQKNLRHQVIRWYFDNNDRAQAERRTEGVAKLIVSPRGKILGISIAGVGAGELLQPWILAMQNKIKLSALASMIAPYPTMSEMNKRLAGKYYEPKIFNKTIRKVVKFLGRSN